MEDPLPTCSSHLGGSADSAAVTGVVSIPMFPLIRFRISNCAHTSTQAVSMEEGDAFHARACRQECTHLAAFALKECLVELAAAIRVDRVLDALRDRLAGEDARRVREALSSACRCSLQELAMKKRTKARLSSPAVPRAGGGRERGDAEREHTHRESLANKY